MMNIQIDRINHVMDAIKNEEKTDSVTWIRQE